MSRKEIVSAFKILHRSAKKAFDGDIKTLTAARQRINDEFKKNLSQDEKLETKLKTAEDVAKVLDKQVVQLVKNPEAEHFRESFSL